MKRSLVDIYYLYKDMEFELLPLYKNGLYDVNDKLIVGITSVTKYVTTLHINYLGRTL